MRFFRNESQTLEKTAWVIHVPVGTLGTWNQGFDDQMVPYQVVDRRGKSGKVTLEVVRHVIDEAKEFKAGGKRLRIQKFTSYLNEKFQLNLGRKTIADILVANDLYKVETRKKRPRFYRSLCRRIPNGLLSLDGSELVVWINDAVEKFIVELGVDVGSFCHTGFGIHRTETAEAVIEVLEAHRRQWGVPLGVVFDHGTANLSDDVANYLKDKGIDPVPAGPGNPKGNGTDEGAFSQMKRTFGEIRIDASSPETLAKSVLKKLVTVYITMRNQMSLRRSIWSPTAHIKAPVTDTQRQEERQKLSEHKRAKNAPDANQPKYDRLDWIIRSHNLNPEQAEIDHARSSIRGYDIQAISKTEEAFLKAVNRDARRKNLSYFFGILRNIQRDMDNDRYQLYCRERYNYQHMLEVQRRQDEELKAPPKIEIIVDMALKAVTEKARVIKELAERRVRQWIQELLGSVRYVGSVKKKIQDAIGSLSHLDLEQKEQIWRLIEQFLNQKPEAESVTLVS
ncbi:hypothetical protein ACFLZM_07885 [Thermodesulfobacteriota bacterium]